MHVQSCTNNHLDHHDVDGAVAVDSVADYLPQNLCKSEIIAVIVLNIRWLRWVLQQNEKLKPYGWWSD